jgi:hypothetical protein
MTSLPNLPLVVTFNYASTSLRPPLWSSGQSSWLQIERPGFDSRPYQIFWKVVGLERHPLSLMSTIEELLERENSGSCLESRKYDRRDPSRWPCDIFYQQKLVLTSTTNCGRSVGLVRSLIKATEITSLQRQGRVWRPPGLLSNGYKRLIPRG